MRGSSSIPRLLGEAVPTPCRSRPWPTSHPELARPSPASAEQVFLKLPLFRLCEKEELLLLTQCLHPGLALPDEALVREGEYGVGLFFLMKGGVVVTRKGQRVCFVYAVTAFGESALLRNAKPVATVRAVGYCEVNVLMRTDFERVAMLNPHILRYLQLYTDQRDAQLDERERSCSNKNNRSSGRNSFRDPASTLRGSGLANSGTEASASDGADGRSSPEQQQRQVTIRESFNEIMRRSIIGRRFSGTTTSAVAPAYGPP